MPQLELATLDIGKVVLAQLGGAYTLQDVNADADIPPQSEGVGVRERSRNIKRYLPGSVINKGLLTTPGRPAKTQPGHPAEQGTTYGNH